ncbi:hypothetical protein RJ640_024234 [Escallonia rubra]|uniref:RING-type E3 ubiquitin transferase n=1 Tax=Escallonia rubra TaxID=112253 RepID=A0AA88QKJ1_9ASTE|nr:hypothetical protein RJ640_024234 [Escallonia rubra]
MSALSTLAPPQFSDLTTSLSSLFCRHHCRLSSILSSPTLFTLTLHHLHSLSLHQKSLLVARYLSSTLSHLTCFFHAKTTPSLHTATAMIKLRDLDTVLLLLILCELRQHEPKALETSLSNWRVVLCNYFSDTMLKLSGLGVSSSEVLITYNDVVTKCWRFVSAMGCGSGGGGVEKDGREVAASAAVVVALPSVEVNRGGNECVICKEEMREGRDVCQLPCDHLFHWKCILPWLRKRNSCPCCRHRLPTDDVFGEIERLWEVLVKAGGSNLPVML